MISLLNLQKAQKRIADNFRTRRLYMSLTQEGLANRSGVSLPTLRKFEQKGLISFESFLKLSIALGVLEKITKITEPEETKFSSIDDVLRGDTSKKRKRGRISR